jgi:hypothetical protein
MIFVFVDNLTKINAKMIKNIITRKRQINQNSFNREQFTRLFLHILSNVMNLDAPYVWG